MRSSLVVLLATASAFCLSVQEKRDPLARALHARLAARSNSIEQTTNGPARSIGNTEIPATTTDAPVSTSSSTADAQNVASMINQIFLTLQNAVAPQLAGIQSVINDSPSIKADELRRNSTYSDAVKAMAGAFEDAAASTKQLLSNSGRPDSNSVNARRAQQTFFTPILTAFAGIANQAEQVCSTGPLGDVVFVDLFTACNPVISDLFGTLNDLIGDLTKTLSDLLGGLTSGGILGSVVPSKGLLDF